MSIYIKDGLLYVPSAQDKLRQKGQERPGFFSDYTMIDIETTGLSPYHDRITELGGFKVCDGQVVKTFATLAKFPKNNQVPAFITRLNEVTEVPDIHGMPLTPQHIFDLFDRLVENTNRVADHVAQLADQAHTLNLADKLQNAEKNGSENSNKSSDNAEKNVVQSVSEKTVDEPTKETDETPKRHWWQFGRKFN